MNNDYHFAVCPPITSLGTDMSSDTISVQTITIPYSRASLKLANKIQDLINKYIVEMARNPKYLMLNYKKYCLLAGYLSNRLQSPFLPEDAFGLQVVIYNGPVMVAGDPKDDFLYQSQQELYKKKETK